MKERPVTAVTIATSDSGGGAGIQADLLTFAAHGVYGATVLVAATAQNSKGIQSVRKLPVAFLAEQIDAVFSDFKPQAVKIGALLDAARVQTVAEGLRRWRAKNVVVDPVMASTGGTRLLSRVGIGLLKKDLLPLCDLVTPNLPEAEAICGFAIENEEGRHEAARAIVALGVGAVLIKGGHAAGARVSDLSFDGRRFREILHERIATKATHGTGCTLSSAIAANLALGHGLETSVRRAIGYLEKGLKRGLFPGRGRGVPDHFPPLRRGP